MFICIYIGLFNLSPFHFWPKKIIEIIDDLHPTYLMHKKKTKKKATINIDKIILLAAIKVQNGYFVKIITLIFILSMSN